MLATTGDVFAELIDSHRLGRVVPYQDEEAIAESVIHLLSHPDELIQIKQRMASVQEQFCWKSVVKPLQVMIEQLSSLPRLEKKWQTRKAIIHFLIHKMRENGLMACCQKAFAK